MNDPSVIEIRAPGVDTAAIVLEIQDTVARNNEQGLYADARIARAERTNLVNLRDDEGFIGFYLTALREARRTGSLLAPIIASVEARGTRCIVLSATDAALSDNHMEALEIDDLNHGLFSSFALEALAGEADTNRDRLVTTEEFQKYVGEKVSHIAALEGKSQTGWFHINNERKSYALPSWRQ